jgi:hypothetical protein
MLVYEGNKTFELNMLQPEIESVSLSNLFVNGIALVLVFRAFVFVIF